MSDGLEEIEGYGDTYKHYRKVELAERLVGQLMQLGKKINPYLVLSELPEGKRRKGDDVPDDQHLTETLGYLAAVDRITVTGFGPATRDISDILKDSEPRLESATNRMYKELVWKSIFETLEFYMGKNTPERRDFIMENLL